MIWGYKHKGYVWVIELNSLPTMSRFSYVDQMFATRKLARAHLKKILYCNVPAKVVKMFLRRR
jgi:D-alanine-D-alanine ligase-like ATP-grasp enzyme